MTIYKVIPQDKKQEKKLKEKDALEVPLTSVDDGTAAVGSAVLIPRRSKVWINLFLILLALLVLATGITGGYYLYKSHIARSPKAQKGFCKFFLEKEIEEDEIMPTPLPQGQENGGGKRKLIKAVPVLNTDNRPLIDHGGLEYTNKPKHNIGRYGKKHRGHHRHHKARHFTTIQMQEDLEVMDGKYEKIKMPHFEDILDSLILHDFERNYSAIVDYNDNRCYVMNLDRGMVSPPKNLIDLIDKIYSGYYLPRADVLHRRYRVMSPALDDIRFLGPYIDKECIGYKTYKLEKMTGDEARRTWFVKRSAPQECVYGYYEDSLRSLMRFELSGCRD